MKEHLTAKDISSVGETKICKASKKIGSEHEITVDKDAWIQFRLKLVQKMSGLSKDSSMIR